MHGNYTISFDDVSIGDGNKLATELKNYLVSMADINAIITQENPNTQDIGSVLTIILGSTAIKTLVTGLSNWLLKTQSRKITIKKDGTIIGENLSSGDVKRILEHIQ